MSATRTDRPEPNADRIVRSPEPEQRFRANTVEEAIAQARDALGPDVEIVGANRIRRGGIGGFFATELGVEIVARGTGHAERTDVFEPFTGVQTAPAASPSTPEPRMTPASRPPAPRPWSVDQTVAPATPAARVVADPSVPAARARQAWRAAADETAAASPAASPAVTPDPDDLVGQLSMPGLEVPAEPTTFADHFLRELLQDADQLRRTPDRNRVLPVREPAARESTVDADEPVPVRRRTASMAAAGVTPGATEPLGAPEPLTGTPVTRPAIERTDTPTLPGMPAPAPKRPRAPRAKRSGTGTVRSTAERRAAEEAAAKAAAEAEAAADAARAGGPRALIGELIDHCVQVTSDAESGAAKIALAVTLPDGSVMKVSIERPRRTGRGAQGGA